MDTPPELPAELRAFLYACIDAVEQIDIIVLLHRTGRPLSARAVAEFAGLTDASARHHLETLTARGVLHVSTGSEVAYAYGPKTADLQRYSALLLEHYASSRTQVIQFVASTPRRSMKTFSDAFKLRNSDQ